MDKYMHKQANIHETFTNKQTCIHTLANAYMQGNGNAVLFKTDPKVTTLSMHCVGNYFSAVQKSDYDVELPEGCTVCMYACMCMLMYARVRKCVYMHVCFIKMSSIHI